MATKILVLTDASGNLVRFRLMPGQRYDSVEVPPLIDGIAFDRLIADEAFDSNALFAELNKRGAKIVISHHPARAQKLNIDAGIYAWRHLHRELLLQAEGVQAYRSARLQDRPQLRAMIYLATAVINSR